MENYQYRYGEIQVGDIVEILHGKVEWNQEMDRFIGLQVKVTEVYAVNGYLRIIFANDESWYWQSRFSHFKLIKKFNSCYFKIYL